MNRLKQEKPAFWKQPADFWIGAGIVASAFIAILELAMPIESCSKLISWVGECPPPVWFLILVWLSIYFLIAWMAYKLGRGG